MYLRERPHRLLLHIEWNSSPTNSHGGKARSASSYTNEANFDSNMVIILAALLCALICALGLNSIMRCALRCSRRFAALETPDETAARLSSTGLKRSTLRQIPVAVYGSELNFSPSTDCPICLGEFVDGEKVRILPQCNHGFHVSCIDTWLVSHSSCPTCRRSLLDYPTCSVVALDVDAGVMLHGNGSGGGHGNGQIASDEVG